MKKPAKLSPYQTVSSHIAWSCPWYSVRQDQIITPDGRPGVYNTITKGDAVWIVPVTAAGELVLIYNYRYTVDDWCWEVPAGSVKPGQSREEAARDELREEIGGVAQGWSYIGRSYLANGICDEVGHFYLATGVILGQPAHEATEVLEIHPTPIPVALRMARGGEISDGPTILALLWCENALRQLADGQNPIQ